MKRFLQQAWVEFADSVLIVDDSKDLEISRTIFFSGVIAFLGIAKEQNNSLEFVLAINDELEEFYEKKQTRG